MVFTRHPVDVPVITQPWGANKTGGVAPNINGTAIQQLVYHYGNYQPEGHDGIDYGCPIGTPVKAPGNAVVEYAGWGQNMPQHLATKYGFVYGPGGWASGILVCLAMDGGQIGAYVAHLSDWRVHAGQRVTAGTLLGLSGNTGRSGGPHVHFSAIRFPVNYSDRLYSRVNPLPLFTTVTHVPIRPGATGSTTTKEPTLSAAEVEQINEHATAQANRVIKYVGDILVAGYTVGPQKFPGATKVDIENQRRISALTSLVTQALSSQTNLTAEEITAAVEKGMEKVVQVDINVKGAPNVE